jgi:hypothetical protein
MENFDKNRVQKSLIITNSILGFFSSLSSILTIYIFITRPLIRDYIFKLAFFLSISELINNIAYFFSLYYIKNPNIYEDKNSVLCDIQYFVIIYSEGCSLLWILMICYGIYDLFVNKNQKYNKNKTKHIIACFLLPLIPSIM